MWLILAALSALMLGSAQKAPPPDPLQPIQFLVGRWSGTSQGQPGSGKSERAYTRILNSKYIRGQSRAVYAPNEKNPKGETHEDIAIFSFDSTRRRLVLRQFHVEGFVNQYAADPTATPGKLVFTSEAIENIPAGWRARETYIVLSADEFEEIFELAEPGKDFEVYSRTRLTRVRQ